MACGLTPCMLATTDAIVLALQPHSDKAHLLHVYTRTHGRVNLLVFGLGRKHAIGTYQPFSVIQITADFPPELSAKPPILKEAIQVTHIPYYLSGTKQAIALFLSEILSITLRHPMPDEPLFQFLTEEVTLLAEEAEPQNFHLRFMADYAAQLGFAIDERTHPDLLSLPSSRAERQDRLHKLCAYYSEHVDTWQSPRSLDVLIEVFD